MKDKRNVKTNRLERLLLRSELEKEMEKRMNEIWVLQWPRYI
ncbi:MAG TPA: hypothetical protein PLB79_06250 [Thermotogota bacterium]|jgi:hypothetical protein|nr:MAG: hypothetical protein BWX67_02178 [Thermotogota bacterium ADurb.Bin062]HNW47712.1 hypothetical protein [Thermotogota bacterium]HNY82806.1 hypothetical protein [Thermotogota bacterium]HOD90722.1 hypothetical protein [Thermotogota bacterium]HOF23781.1 hypothetical protein [Thermotogota bacterium]